MRLPESIKLLLGMLGVLIVITGIVLPLITLFMFLFVRALEYIFLTLWWPVYHFMGAI